ncbi:MAG: DUF3048 domain-containing protein, partial [Actinobacteria bacterium]|nr:DUF3048 domain-containing protein [Actinomycetota bacterium]
MRNRTSLALIAAASVLAPVLASCGGGGGTADGSADTSVASVSTDPAAPAVVYPLTGLPVDDAAKAARPALVAKIDNHPNARPQAGLNKADIVIEENVEGLTRFAAVFHSDGSDPVGPLRSGRTQDKIFLGSYNKPLFMWSGGNYRVTQVINAQDPAQPVRQHHQGMDPRPRGFGAAPRAVPVPRGERCDAVDRGSGGRCEGVDVQRQGVLEVGRRVGAVPPLHGEREARAGAAHVGRGHHPRRPGEREERRGPVLHLQAQLGRPQEPGGPDHREGRRVRPDQRHH